MNLYLIGYRGSGKSTVAPLLAKRLNWPTVDSDDLVESDSEMSIAEIFSQQGENEFRILETQAIATISDKPNQVVSLGGGAPTFEVNRELIRQSGKVAWLDAQVDVLWARICGDETSESRRPDLTDEGGRQEVAIVLAKRNPVYAACADFHIRVDKLSPQEIADAIFDWLQVDDKE